MGQCWAVGVGQCLAANVVVIRWSAPPGLSASLFRLLVRASSCAAEEAVMLYGNVFVQHMAHEFSLDLFSCLEHLKKGMIPKLLMVGLVMILMVMNDLVRMVMVMIMVKVSMMNTVTII